MVQAERTDRQTGNEIAASNLTVIFRNVRECEYVLVHHFAFIFINQQINFLKSKERRNSQCFLRTINNELKQIV